MHVMQPKDMFKQARQISRASQDETVPGGEAKKRGGQELRQYLLEKFAAEGMSGSEVATLAHYITRAGGLGLEDLALDPKSASKNGHRHVRNHAGQIFPEVGMTPRTMSSSQKTRFLSYCGGYPDVFTFHGFQRLHHWRNGS